MLHQKKESIDTRTSIKNSMSMKILNNSNVEMEKIN
jgi:hypothetical protein